MLFTTIGKHGRTAQLHVAEEKEKEIETVSSLNFHQRKTLKQKD